MLGDTITCTQCIVPDLRKLCESQVSLSAQQYELKRSALVENQQLVEYYYILLPIALVSSLLALSIENLNLALTSDLLQETRSRYNER